MFGAAVGLHLMTLSVAFAARPLVTLGNGGQLEGIYQTTFGNRTINAFLGVPYGKAERFASPKSPDAWEGVRDAGSPTPFCLQYNFGYFLPGDPTDKITGIEDCLLVDVYTPILPVKKYDAHRKKMLLPVVVFFPTGNFASLGARSFGGKYLLDQDVVLVSVNHRLGIFGFLSTEDDVIPGNWGLKDQALALQWVKTNIRVFGGDPNRVTLVGHSSGAASAHMHLFSPLSKGLFHRAISMSGSAGNYWALMAQPKEKAQQLGALMNCSNVEDSAKLLECLQSKDGKEIAATLPIFQETSSTPFAPVVEVPSQTAFLTETPIKMLAKQQAADVPMIFTATQGEALLYFGGFLVNTSAVEALDKSWNDIIPRSGLLNYKQTVDAKDINSVSQEIREHYFQTKKISNETLPRLNEVLTDRFIFADTTYMALLQAHYNSAPVYSYLFSYFGSASSGTLTGATLDQLRPYGPNHFDDLAYIFNTPIVKTVNTDDDIAVGKGLVNIVASFAKTGKPEFGKGVIWEQIQRIGIITNNINYLHINSATDFKMDQKINAGDYLFWNLLPMDEPATKRRGRKSS